MSNITDYIKDNYDNYVEELKEYLKIPSVSSSAEHKKDILECAEFTAQKLRDAGLSTVEIHETEGHPIVYGEWLGAPGKPTVLIYGHYDVQPVDPIDLWESPPFDPVVKDDKIFARGATDDKGQLFVHIKSVEAFFKANGSLPCNVKFMIEGEEEIGSPSLEPFIKLNKDKLKCDSVIVSDTSLYGDGIPTITYGLRGLAYFEVEVFGPSQDLHSGTYGGAVANPINILSKMIAQLRDKRNKVTIPGFYEDVKKMTKKEKENLKNLKHSDKALMKEVGVKELYGEQGYSSLERLWARPSLDCNGILGGFVEEGAKTIIPSKAMAKISMRLVPDQKPAKVKKQFIKYIKEIAPESVKVTVKDLHSGDPVLVPIESKANTAASKALERAFGKKTVFMREGGSIPIVAAFDKHLKAPTVLLGLGLNSENLHSPNEHFHLKHFRLGVLTSAYFFEEFSK